MILSIATEMKRAPEEINESITILEKNMIDTVESLKECSHKNLKDLGLPLGLVNKIIQRLEQMSAVNSEQEKPA